VAGGAGHADVRKPVGAVDQQGLGAAETFLLVPADDQAGEQLRQSKIVTGETMTMFRKALSRK
jgi:hypothetical protein